jgi:glutaredoxin
VKVNLYGTAGCHLCEQAKELVWPLVLQYQFRLIEIDIADNDDLIERFGTLIPVLTAYPTHRELRWPFTAEEIDAFFAELFSM